MSSTTLTIKCKSEAGLITLSDLTSDSTVLDLKSCVQKLIHIKPEAMKILFGYPPKALDNNQDDSKLHEVNISSGDTIIIETIKLPEATSNTLVSDASTSNASCIVQEDPGQVKMTKEKELEQMMFSQGGIFMRHVVPSDNSCLFNSVGFLLSGGQLNPEKCSELRQIIAKTVMVNPEKYNAAMLGKENSEYFSWILDESHWGGAIELAILSEHFKMEIVAVDTITLSMLRFGENDNYSQRIFLIYDGIHYDPLILELENTTQYVFSVTETSALDMALEVAKEAQSSRQFTDVANFTVACEVCNVRLCGEKEALEHAKNTGHNKFGEL